VNKENNKHICSTKIPITVTRVRQNKTGRGNYCMFCF